MNRFLKRWWWKKTIALSAISIENLKTRKYHRFFYITLVLSIICEKSGSKHKTIFKEQESIEISKISCLINM